MIRPFQATHTDRMIDIWYKASLIAHPFLTEAFLEQEKKNIREVYIPHTQSWVWEDAKGMQGFISMIDNEIGGLFVDPDCQRAGIGHRLADHVRELHPVLKVEVFRENVIGRAFYEKYGFVKAGELLHEETGNWLVEMVLGEE